jgi:hypothetical protein
MIFTQQPLTLKVVLKASSNISTGENRPMAEQESRNGNSGVAVVTIYRIWKCFQNGKEKLYTYFYL